MRTKAATKTPDLFAMDAPIPRAGKCWIAVASADHVRKGVADSIMQVCHGKAARLRRVSPGDRVAYYSPSTTFGGGERMQAFTVSISVEI